MSRKQTIITVAGIIIVIAIGFGGYKILDSNNQKKLELALEQQNRGWVEKTEKMQGRINELESMQAESAMSEGDDLIPEKTETGITEKKPEVSLAQEDVERRIASFFVGLDEDGYTRKYKIKKSIYSEYEDAVQKLSQKRPLISNETESLYNVFLNIAHFYRVLGKDKIALFTDILSKENDSIEPMMRDFYLWYTNNSAGRKKVKGRPSEEVLFDYAGFFLNTIGGRNYLMRRDSKVRILTTYYCVLLMDMANDLKKNPNGIDIRPYIKLINSDISGKTDLAFREDYLNNLNRLMNKYNINS